jgi:hypothetical protein
MSDVNANPFEVLRLDPATPADEVVRQAGRLRQRAADEATVAAIRQAVQALTGRPEERLLHELLTHPAPCHAWPALERFTAAFRRPPLPAAEAQAACPPLRDSNKNTPGDPVSLDCHCGFLGEYGGIRGSSPRGSSRPPNFSRAVCLFSWGKQVSEQ